MRDKTIYIKYSDDHKLEKMDRKSGAKREGRLLK